MFRQARLEPVDELRDRLRLIACRLVSGIELKRSLSHLGDNHLQKFSDLDAAAATLKIASPTRDTQRLLDVNMRLAQRVQRIRPSATVSVTALAAKLRSEGQDIIALSVGEPDFPTPEHICSAAREAIERGETKYTVVDGSPALKQAVIEKFRRDNGLVFEPEQILISCGAKQACLLQRLPRIARGRR